ncbi:MAG: flagellar basal body rod protein FlgC [Armatimonadota bacterium]
MPVGAFSIFDTAASALAAQRVRMDVIANNLANANTAGRSGGEPYRRQVVVFAERATRATAPAPFAEAILPGGVDVVAVVPDDGPPRLVYDPGHPDADADGYVHLPNVNPMLELVDMISATRAYEASVGLISAARDVLAAALDILR